MPIQYRCRCGQEVTLRLREGIYLVAGLILGLTLLNTALTLFLWLRLTTEPPRRMADRGPLPTSEGLGAATSPAAGGGGAEAARAAEEASSSRSSELEDSRAGLRDQPPSPLVVAPPPEALPSRGLEREEPSPPAKEEEEKVEAQRRPLPRLHRFVRPASLEPLSLALLLDRLPERPIDRSLVLLGALRWGSGDLAGRARDLIPAHSPLLSALAPEWAPAGRGEGSSPPGALEISDEGLPWRSELLTSLEERWDEGWESLLRSAGGPHSLRWITDTREGLRGAADFLVLVDLTESMAAETEASAAALRRLLPLTLGAEGERRWGWVGFRDEVVDRFALTADGDAFLATLQRWRCERGGDVPEGVDEALFEALRFDSFEWNPKARHIFLVIGDAPPPYERISGMVSLVEAAHASPEGFEVRCLGILREAWIEGVPGFQELADASGGMAIFEREGEPLLEAWWRLIVGSAAPAWGEGPFAGGGG